MTVTTPSTPTVATTSVAPTRPDTTEALEDLRRRVSGRLVTPTDPGYARATTPWLVHVPQHPMAVLEVQDTDDVVAAVRWAGDHGLQVTAQPSGHGANRLLGDAVVLRTRALRGIEVDLQRRTALVGAGVKAGELCAALEGTGLTFLCGSNPDPSVVGMTITGGISWFGRAYGLGADSILAAEVVDGLGRLRTVTATEDPELFWALRGGGGDFGIVTRLEVALHHAPAVYGGRLMWPAERMREVLTTFRDTTPSAPETLTTWFHTWSFPPLPEIPEPLRGRSFTGVAVCFLGTPADAEAALASYREIEGPVVDTVGVVAMADLGQVAAEPDDPTPAVMRSHLLERLDNDTVTALVEDLGPGSGSTLPILQVRHLGGAFARHVPDGGSHGPVSEPYLVTGIGILAAPEMAAPTHASLDRLSAAVRAVASGRTLLNFQEDGEEPSLWWDPPTRARLVAAKDACDPNGVLRSNRPVNSHVVDPAKPADGGS